MAIDYDRKYSLKLWLSLKPRARKSNEWKLGVVGKNHLIVRSQWSIKSAIRHSTHQLADFIPRAESVPML